LSFWHGGVGLSFVAFALLGKSGNVCDSEFCVAASGRKTRYGPFMNDGVYRNYEGSCV